MGKTLPDQELEPFSVTLEPRVDSDTGRQVVHSEHEFVYCLQGRIMDSSGLKIFGEGEWKVCAYGKSKRRT